MNIYTVRKATQGLANYILKKDVYKRQGIYIFSWPVLKEALKALSEQPACDFGKHIICLLYTSNF